MKITKRQLRRIIREEKKRIKEACGDIPVEQHAVITVPDAVEAISESQTPEGELVVEMEVASRSLETAIDSIQEAASLCRECVQKVAAAEPEIEAIVTQAAALQETLEAVSSVVTENVDEAVGLVVVHGANEGLPL